MPIKVEADQDSLFSLAFTMNINPKKMKRIEKEYMTMKSKEAEDEMEIRVHIFLDSSFIICYVSALANREPPCEAEDGDAGAGVQ